MLCALLLCGLVAILETNRSKGIALVRIFDNTPDPDEPTEEEENARDERRQYNSFGTMPTLQDTNR